LGEFKLSYAAALYFYAFRVSSSAACLFFSKSFTFKKEKRRQKNKKLPLTLQTKQKIFEVINILNLIKNYTLILYLRCSILCPAPV
jgi:hypothetical protein